ncbi:MAG: Asp-tRNA(Asn)/Glu-tRNA(Gln) amidotransferase GatCAB subunit C [Legionella sp.]|nr:MAG: Asp-tRNA(Asn)/Glu-tRNA(Gln) amidotransferase GatCAB subunit C [Legionella sp.]PJD98741.1 MAG: Asp-tRNA(Asn)/Glu-tRNA(Gln) amidotransferase GatCAB subunit C [Legionella sp.]
MTLTCTDLEKIARLACLDHSKDNLEPLNEEVNSIMNFVEHLRSLDTQQIAPLFHPFALHQRVREDEVTEQECLAELEAIAPYFEDDLYQVPKVIDSDK